MLTPADEIALWASDATGPLQFIVGLVALAMFVTVGIRWARMAGRQT